MPTSAVVLAAIALVACALPGAGMFVAMGAGIGAVGLGWIGFRRRGAPGPRRLLAASAVAIGGLALAMAAVRYAVTLVALGRLVDLLG